MRNRIHAPFSVRLTGAAAMRVLALGVILVSSACRPGEDEASRGVVIINAPAAGEVRRVLVREGMTVSEGAPIVEIAVRSEALATPSPAEDAQARAGRNVLAARD